jgi:hypothetical protein
MTYQEAIEKSFQVKWKVGTCSQGEECWCRTIKPIEPIFFEDGGNAEYYVVGTGELRKETAEHFVKLHNQTFGGDNKRIEADVAELAHKTYPFSNGERNAFIAGYNKFHIETFGGDE